MPDRAFVQHDMTDFPVVRFRGETTFAGYATQWCAEMDRLVQSAQPFVLIYPHSERMEAHEDRVMRGAWLKRNRHVLPGICLALIVIEPDATRRAEMEAIFPNLEKAFGTPQATRATAAQAEALARHMLAGGSLSDAAASAI